MPRNVTKWPSHVRKCRAAFHTDILWFVGPPFVGPLFGRTRWTCLNAPQSRLSLVLVVGRDWTTRGRAASVACVRHTWRHIRWWAWLTWVCVEQTAVTVDSAAGELWRSAVEPPDQHHVSSSSSSSFNSPNQSRYNNHTPKSCGN